MKLFTKRAVSTLLTAAVALCSFTAIPANAEEESAKPDTVTVTFDISEEGIALTPDDEGKIPDGIDSIIDKPGSSYRMPTQTLEKPGYSFEGWSCDGVKGFLPDAVFQLPETDAVYKPVWFKDDYDDTYKINYTVEIDGKLLGKGEKPSVFYAPEGKIVKVSTKSCEREGYYQKGWILPDGTEFTHGEYLVMPGHDVEFTPIWKKYVIINYVVGDVDRVNGAVKADFEKLEGGSIELQKNDRFSRSGFKLTGWLCSVDNKVYLPEQTYTVPGEDVTMTAVWTPIKYTMVFNPGAGGDIIKLKGETDTSVVLPEPGTTKPGYKFSGWKFDGEIYKPGDDYQIKGVMPGLGYLFEGVWEKDNGEVITTTEAATTTTTTSSTTYDSTTTTEATCVTDSSSTFYEDVSTTIPVVHYYSVEAFDKESGEPVYDQEISCVFNQKYGEGEDAMYTGPVVSCTPTKGQPGIISYEEALGASKFYLSDFRTDYQSPYEVNDSDVKIEQNTDSTVIGVKVYLTKRPDLRIRFFDELTHYPMKSVSVTLIKMNNDGTPGTTVDNIELTDNYIYDAYGLDKTASYTVLCNSKGETTSKRSKLPIRFTQSQLYQYVDVFIQPWYYNAGDANCDGQVNIADAVLVMQVATNPDKYEQGKSDYSISEMGKVNADVDGKKGLTNADALLIQKFKLGLIEDFRQ